MKITKSAKLSLLTNQTFWNTFPALPIREHTALTHKGVVKEHSKFDERDSL